MALLTKPSWNGVAYSAARCHCARLDSLGSAVLTMIDGQECSQVQERAKKLRIECFARSLFAAKDVNGISGRIETMSKTCCRPPGPEIGDLHNIYIAQDEHSVDVYGLLLW